jgi:HAD superfamily hydrolase (TIGR01450 family)
MDFDAYQAVLLDLDGTLYREEHALPGAAELVQRLRADGRNYACLSNSTGSPQRLVARLDRMGIHVAADRIYTATAAAADYVLEKWGGEPRVFNLASEGVQDLLEGRVRWVQDAGEACDAIIVGTPKNYYAGEERQRMALELARRGAALIGTSADRVYPSPRGMEFGAGALAWMLAYAADTTPTFTGKPQAVFFNKLCQHIGAEPGRCVLIGDNLESDIAGAKAMGMATILTLTGVARAEDVEGLSEGARPDRVVKDLRELVG